MSLKKDSTAYTFLFALIICVICSFSLALVSEGLRPKRELNQAIDVKKNILKAVGLREPLSEKPTVEEIESTFDSKIEEIIIDENGETVEGKSLTDLTDEDPFYPVYIYREGQQVISYAFPIVGKGLWSTLYGYIALEPDAKLIRGITFYKHGETPGLGAEIEKDWFQENFKGKAIWDFKANKLWPVAVIKGKVTDKMTDKDKMMHAVDGISGATITSKGVTEMIDREVKKYEPFFSKKRREH